MNKTEKLTYIIGDVHGEYGSLLQLVKKLPQDSNLIFVGDLVDRGLKSKEVIKFVRENNYQCVLGNHEDMMIEFAQEFEKKYPNFVSMTYFHSWMHNGGKETLFSYGLIEVDEIGKLVVVEDDKKFQEFLDDVRWLKTLPFYIELSTCKEDKPIVISHAPIAHNWNCSNHSEYRYDEYDKIVHTMFALWERILPKSDSPIFNIFGHTPVKDVVIDKNYINVDTGCYFSKDGFGRLSAYCVESGEVIST
jgi:serine/threonine protein phosphatase 1